MDINIVDDCYTLGTFSVVCEDKDAIKDLIKVMKDKDLLNFDEIKDLDHEISFDRYAPIINITKNKIYSIDVKFNDDVGEGDFFVNVINTMGDMIEDHANHMQGIDAQRLKDTAFTITYKYIDMDFTEDILMDCQANQIHRAGEPISKCECYADKLEELEPNYDNLVKLLGDDDLADYVNDKYESGTIYHGREI